MEYGYIRKPNRKDKAKTSARRRADVLCVSINCNTQTRCRAHRNQSPVLTLVLIHRLRLTLPVATRAQLRSFLCIQKHLYHIFLPTFQLDYASNTFGVFLTPLAVLEYFIFVKSSSKSRKIKSCKFFAKTTAVISS